MSVKIIDNTKPKVELTSIQYDIALCQANPDKLYVFGDNMYKMGTRGQACIRSAKNSIGITTKVFPSNKGDKPFFIDNSVDHAQVITDSIHEVLNKYKDGNYKSIVFSIHPLGSGNAQMKNRCPNLFNFLNTELRLKFGIIIENGIYNLEH